MSVTQLLKRVHLFRGLNSQELTLIEAICQHLTLQPGDLIIEQNTTGKEMYIIAEGSVDVFVQGLENARGLVMLGKGQVIGEMALIDQGYRSASVKATDEGATLYLIDSDAFMPCAMSIITSGLW
ncbi:MAG: cyclic nucleotide-binding domain-containing protein [Anaerolineae bacterium]|nr:cyclic nucleotide-binding domain-containing protein [Anaerolineae bacterium]